tara:strand:- start:922 stop:1791 length:870 start_codon:yes stop_codon:yes gene_type:complete
MTVISEQFDAMHRDIRALNNILKRTRPMAALAYPLPNTPKGMEGEPVKTIPVREHTGEEAVSLAAACYQDLHINPSYSQKVARRTVGAIWLSPLRDASALEIPDLVERINAAKTAIEEYVIGTFSTRQERFEALRAECPGIMTMHLYRHIRCFSHEKVLSVRFTWQRKDSLSKPVKNDLVRRISEELERSGPDYRLPLEQLLSRLDRVPESSLRVRRQVRVQPVANIRVGDGLKTVTAPMPLLFIQEQPIKHKALAEFRAEDQRKTRSDKVAAEILGTFGGVTIEAFPA